MTTRAAAGAVLAGLVGGMLFGVVRAGLPATRTLLIVVALAYALTLVLLWLTTHEHRR